MKQKTLWLIIGWIIFLPSITLADGKFYAREEIPPDLPYQRAIIAYQDNEELLILQSKFEGKGEDFGWVVPLPSLPKLGSIPAEFIEQRFRMLDLSTQPKVIYGRDIMMTIIGGISLLVLLSFGLVGSIIYAIKKRPQPKWQKKYFIGLPIGLFSFCLLYLGFCSPSTMMGIRGVKILQEQKVGVYDTTVIKATDTKELIDWLNQHGYKFTPQDETSFKSYIEKGWCFVTARVNAEELQKDEFRSASGLVNPLVFLFKSKEIVYPLSLTGTIGKETKILLYVFAEHKTSTDTRFKMVFAGKQSFYLGFIKEIDPPDFLEDIDFKPGYLTKFRDTLTPEEMKHDLIFSPAPDDKPYRETVVRW